MLSFIVRVLLGIKLLLLLLLLVVVLVLLRCDTLINVSHLAGVDMGFHLLSLHNCDPNIYKFICSCLEAYFTEKFSMLIQFFIRNEKLGDVHQMDVK